MKKIIIIIFIAILCGGIFSYTIYKKMDTKPITEYKTVSAFQIGVYKKYENAKKISDRNNGIIIEENDTYRVYTSILSDNESINKMKAYYDSIGLIYYIKEINVTNTFINNLKNYEILINKSNSDTYTTINKDILKIYKEYK